MWKGEPFPSSWALWAQTEPLGLSPAAPHCIPWQQQLSSVGCVTEGGTFALISGLEVLGGGSREAARPEHRQLCCPVGAVGPVSLKAQGP